MAGGIERFKKSRESERTEDKLLAEEGSDEGTEEEQGIDELNSDGETQDESQGDGGEGNQEDGNQEGQGVSTEETDKALENAVATAAMSGQQRAQDGVPIQPEDSGEGIEAQPDGGPEPGTEPDEADFDYDKLNVRKKIEYRLTHGATVEELVDEGFNVGSVKTIASELRSRGLLEVVPRGAPRVSSSSSRALTKSNQRSLSAAMVRGSPPEILIDTIKLPDSVGGSASGQVFEQGMKFGLSISVLGIRMAQELSSLGVSQAKPVIDMAKAMREGEAIAAKAAAIDASGKTADAVVRTLGPEIEGARLAAENAQALADKARVAANAKTIVTTKNPMKDMMVKQMEPLVNNLFGSMLNLLSTLQPALAQGQGQGQAQGQQVRPALQPAEQDADSVPDGWRREEG